MTPQMAGLQEPGSGHVGFLQSTDWLHPEPWVPPAPLRAGSAPFQWRFENVSVTCAQDAGATQRMAALPNPRRVPHPPLAEQGQYCFSAADRGESYRGVMASSASRRPCVPWGSPGQPAGANVLSPYHFPHSYAPPPPGPTHVHICGALLTFPLPAQAAAPAAGVMCTTQACTCISSHCDCTCISSHCDQGAVGDPTAAGRPAGRLPVLLHMLQKEVKVTGAPAVVWRLRHAGILWGCWSSRGATSRAPPSSSAARCPSARSPRSPCPASRRPRAAG